MLTHTMTDAELQEKLDAAAEKGATRALEKVGLHDAAAGKDITELRGLLEAWRMMKTTAAKSAVSRMIDILVAAVLLGLALKFGFKLNS